MIEETHYYPFGLTMAGISSKAAGGIENKKKYNGIEFDEDLDIDTYEAFYRNLDPQTGRWWQIDPKIENMEMWSPYASNFDNPITHQDPLGDEPEEVQGPGPNAIATLSREIYNVYRLYRAGESLGNSLRQIKVDDVISAFAPITIDKASMDKSKAMLNAVIKIDKIEGIENEIKTLEHGIKNHKSTIKEHEQKLADYKKDPDKEDNKGALKEVSKEIRDKKIQGRIDKLQKQINNQTKALKRDLQKLAEKKKELEAIKK